MRILHRFLIVPLLAAFTIADEELIAQQSSGFVLPLQRRMSQQSAEDSQPAEAINYRAQIYEYEDEDQQTISPQNRRQQQLQQQYQRKGANSNLKQIQEELEEEIEEPDRLSQLLEKSDFNCNGRTGYYADEGLGCEVFHYCQENQKHSWICPEGFAFHQIHLICMPPSSDNICEQSSKYHIVNDYLYKPINVEEHQTKPNITLRYSERYYPESFYHDERQDRQQEYQQERRQPIQVGLRKGPTTPQPTYGRQQQQQQQQNVYRSPDEINISLQQRRPQIIFSPTSTRAYDDEHEYSYEK